NIRSGLLWLSWKDSSNHAMIVIEDLKVSNMSKLGRWHDSKRSTSSPGWVVMWDGWFRHQDMAEGYLVMKSLDQEI
ncbi:transposase, partial [Escherichia coli O111:NM str. K6723]